MGQLAFLWTIFLTVTLREFLSNVSVCIVTELSKLYHGIGNFVFLCKVHTTMNRVKNQTQKKQILKIPK